MNPLTKIRDWDSFVRQLRGFFAEKGFLEVSTDFLVPVGAFEGSIDTLKVSYAGGQAELHSSPEIEMKVCLAQCKVPIFQICKCFRDDPPTGIHWREFTMLEFYRPFSPYFALIQDMRQLMDRVAGKPLPFLEITMSELIRESTGLILENLLEPEPLRREISDRKLLSLSADDTWEDMFFKLMIEKVEPWLDPKRPTIVKDYPPLMSALGKLNPETGFTERFEIYWKSMELCNGCSELQNLTELQSRFCREQENRARQGKLSHPFPERLLQAMSQGFPPCSGVAVGLDRLFKCVYGYSIRQ